MLDISYFFFRRKGFCLFLLLACWLLSACATAPYTGRSQLMMVDAEEERALGLSYAQEVLRQSKEVTNTPGAAMVRRVGRRIAQAAELPDPAVPAPVHFDWQFHTLQDKEINAFCLPGGAVFVNTGLLNAVRNEDELAAVVGHEVAHALVRHGAERMSQQYMSSVVQLLGAAAVGIATSSSEAMDAFSSAYGAGVSLGILLPFSRTQESEADYVGLILAAKAGYDPKAALTFWERVAAAAEKNENSRTAEWASTHPSDATRIENIKRLLPEVEKYRPQSTPSGQVR